jgi:dethiobiotin synthetase
MKPLFVTGTDTGVGKTRVATALLRALASRGTSVAGMKPVASGCSDTPEGLRNDDALALQAASSVRLRYADVNPCAFAPAIAPHIAAEEADQPIELHVLEHAYQRLALLAERVIIEGAGGWLTPIGPRHTLADFASLVDADVVLVVGLRLGCLNHALLTSQAVRAAGLQLAGWVGNAIDPGFERAQANLAALRRLKSPCLGVLPWAPEAKSHELAALLRLDTLASSSPADPRPRP